MFQDLDNKGCPKASSTATNAVAVMNQKCRKI